MGGVRGTVEKRGRVEGWRFDREKWYGGGQYVEDRRGVQNNKEGVKEEKKIVWELRIWDFTSEKAEGGVVVRGGSWKWGIKWWWEILQSRYFTKLYVGLIVGLKVKNRTKI